MEVRGNKKNEVAGPAGELHHRSSDDDDDTNGTSESWVRRRVPKGGTWRYHWNDPAQLVQVDRPDGTAVAMSYDALGRRLAKNWRVRMQSFSTGGD